MKPLYFKLRIRPDTKAWQPSMAYDCRLTDEHGNEVVAERLELEVVAGGVVKMNLYGVVNVIADIDGFANVHQHEDLEIKVKGK